MTKFEDGSSADGAREASGGAYPAGKLRRGPKTIASLVRSGTWSLTEASAAERLSDAMNAAADAGPRTAKWAHWDGPATGRLGGLGGLSGGTSGAAAAGRFSAAENNTIRAVDDRRLLRRWIAGMSAEGVAVEPVVGILLDGESLSATDSAFGRRKGWARGQLVASVVILLEVERRYGK